MASPPPPASAAAATAHSVFVYGTLMAEEVVRVLLGRVPPSSRALLPNHRRFSIRGRVYPAILPVDGNEVPGKVFKGITDRSVWDSIYAKQRPLCSSVLQVFKGITDGELDVLDIFEDEEYVRETVDISLAVVPHEVIEIDGDDDPDGVVIIAEKAPVEKNKQAAAYPPDWPKHVKLASFIFCCYRRRIEED